MKTTYGPAEHLSMKILSVYRARMIMTTLPNPNRSVRKTLRVAASAKPFNNNAITVSSWAGPEVLVSTHQEVEDKYQRNDGKPDLMTYKAAYDSASNLTPVYSIRAYMIHNLYAWQERASCRIVPA